MSELAQTIAEYVDDQLDTEEIGGMVGIVSDLDPFEVDGDGNPRWSDAEQALIRRIADLVAEANDGGAEPEVRVPDETETNDDATAEPVGETADGA